MTNRHHGNLADVWKHLVLCEVLSLEWPTRYAETHAGSASYPLDGAGPEKQLGVRRFLELATQPPLSESTYAVLTRPAVEADPSTYRGSALLAMSLLGESADYLLCDTDPASEADLRAWAQQWGRTRCHVEQSDGMLAVEAWLDQGDGPTLVHVDPFDPFASVEGGRSAIDLAGHVADRGAALVYWYGYDTPEQRGWPLARLGELTTAALWCGDVLVTTADGATANDGSLGAGTTPGTGFGVVLANVTTDCHVVAERLGQALARAYQGTVWPSGEPGALDVQVIAG